MEAAGHVREKKQVALVSVGAALFITAAKLIVGIQTNSLGVLSEAAHSGLDLVAAIMTYFAVAIADRPADPDHRYGHAKVENISALFETLLLVVTCVWIIYEGIHRLTTVHPPVKANVWSFGVVVVAILIDIGRARALSRVAKRYNSQALEADALHFSSDVWSSLVVLSGLVFVSLGFPWVDAVAAIGVAILVLVVSYRLGRRTVDALMDRIPTGLAGSVEAAIGAVPGVHGVRNLRLRNVGPQTFADVVVDIDRTASFEQAHRIMGEVEEAVRREAPRADVVVHGEPWRNPHESLEGLVKMVVLGAGLAEPHHVVVHNSAGSISVDFHIEFEPGKTLREAHDMASRIETELRRERPEVKTVTIHMEERSSVGRPGGTEGDGLCQEIRREIEAEDGVAGCRECALVRVGDRYQMTIACAFRGNQPLGAVHRTVSMIENRLYQKFPQLDRITIHPEPTHSTK